VVRLSDGGTVLDAQRTHLRASRAVARRRATARGAGGMVLPLMLLLLLALTALGHGALLLSLRELQATWAFRHAVRAGEGAKAGVWLAMGGGEALPSKRPPWIPHVLASGETPDGVTYRGVLRWLDGEFFLLEGIGGSRGWVGEHRAGWVGWSLLPGARLGAFRAAAEVGGAVVLGGEARIEGGSFMDSPDGWLGSWCSSYQEALDSLFAGGGLPALGPLTEPLPIPSEDGDSIPPLGLLRGPELLDRAGEITGSALPSPPGDSVRGCPDGDGPSVFEGTPGSLNLERGRLCGILVVGGDLRLAGDVRVQGLVLVGGDLHLEEGAVLEGMARVGGGLRLVDSALLRSSACPVLRAMEEPAVLKHPLLLREGSRISGF
jgi:hypothetical protein